MLLVYPEHTTVLQFSIMLQFGTVRVSIMLQFGTML